jgi:hypothetical protein
MVGRLNLTDDGISFSAIAYETVSGGQLVKATSGATVLTSGNALDNVIEVGLCNSAADGNFCVGVAQTTATSGNRVTVTTRGIHGFYASTAVVAGSYVAANGAVTTSDAVMCYGNAADSGQNLIIGKAISTAASGQMVAVCLNLG